MIQSILQHVFLVFQLLVIPFSLKTGACLDFNDHNIPVVLGVLYINLFAVVHARYCIDTYIYIYNIHIYTYTHITILYNDILCMQICIYIYILYDIRPIKTFHSMAQEEMLPVSRRNPPSGYYDSYHQDIMGWCGTARSTLWKSMVENLDDVPTKSEQGIFQPIYDTKEGMTRRWSVFLAWNCKSIAPAPRGTVLFPTGLFRPKPFCQSWSILSPPWLSQLNTSFNLIAWFS